MSDGVLDLQKSVEDFLVQLQEEERAMQARQSQYSPQSMFYVVYSCTVVLIATRLRG